LATFSREDAALRVTTSPLSGVASPAQNHMGCYSMPDGKKTYVGAETQVVAVVGAHAFV
jgi:hypothetical protein